MFWGDANATELQAFHRAPDEPRMPNGKPGDHPLTDVLSHGGSEFGEPVDGLVKELARHPAFSTVRERVGNLLLELSPMWRPTEAAELRREAAARLEVIRRELSPDTR